ncbi:DUF2235 domain-containing protein [Cronobacter sakazakii]|uniref:T6SS phospholipase effector Tle1-like catalytic domain-containing protein n=4 Tax=Cronobacter sakazakii TaxID=28141 RepID=UPI00029BD336|nr:DUF2235 domain-containing protein [Cronobacter sakazakii]CCK06855.1 hypothetical protein BN128_717 [Cronobacter sakazakii 696]ELY6404994.1 DUF2235 domain-containing protein [Cronobacter sakazakii]MBF4815886.1 DUF2235 domain-containing protein [Cronobacter sakazakii]MDT3569862.1 DUF2235 domain-containing protein [Cronobacter sakazakii]NCH68502.1 DUF2235 domain-containing protein [Cronobacter sakazakii]
MTDYHTWETSDGSHFTDINIPEKTIVCKRKPVTGITITIGMFFDGTGNNVFNTDIRLLKKCTHLDVGMKKEDAELCYQKLSMGALSSSSYMGYYSNIHWLNTLYVKDDKVIKGQTLYQRAVYVQGIGTQKGEEDSWTAKGTGMFSEGVIDKTDEGVSQIAAQIKTLLMKESGISYAIEKIQFDIFGFSRGAAAARHFANRVRNNDEAIQKAIAEGLQGQNQHGKPAGEIRFIGLFDTVCAVGLEPHNGYNPGINLYLPQDIAQKVFQISAMHECRYNFSLNSIKELWPELSLPGVHSDIGGGYNPYEQEYYFITKPRSETVKDDILPEKTNAYNKAKDEIPKLEKCPNLRPLMVNGEVKTETWYDYLVNHDKNKTGVREKRVGAAVTLKRIVPNDWSKVSLRVMIDAAKEAGVDIKEILPKDKNLTLPKELEALSHKAIVQAQSVICGCASEPFTLSEIQLIGKYIHCSANWNPVEFKTVWLDGKEIKRIYGAVNAVELIGFLSRPDTGWTRAVWNMNGDKA